MVRSEMSCVSSVGMYRQVNVFDMGEKKLVEGSVWLSLLILGW